MTLSGTLGAGTGSGGLTKIGAGTLQLDGALNYTGDTIVDGGTLVLHRAGTLAGGNTGQFGSDGADRHRQ